MSDSLRYRPNVSAASIKALPTNAVMADAKLVSIDLTKKSMTVEDVLKNALPKVFTATSKEVP